MKQVAVANLYNHSSRGEKFPGFNGLETGALQFGITMRHQFRQPPNKAPQLFPLSENFPLALTVEMLLSQTSPSPSLCSGMLSPQKASLVHMLRQPTEANFWVSIELGVHLNIGTNFSSPKLIVLKLVVI